MIKKASYKEELVILGYVQVSVETRMRTISKFLQFCKKETQEILVEDIEKYVDYLKGKRLHTDTLVGYYRMILQYYMYLEREKLIQFNPFNYYDLQIKKQAQAQRHILSQSEIQTLYLVAQKGVETILLHLCYGCGLRAKELERLNIEDVYVLQKTIAVKRGKGNKYRIIPISDKIAEDLEKHIEEKKRVNESSQALLLNHKSVRMKRYTALMILKSIMKRTRIKKNITLHCLRHSIATHLLENGMPLVQVQYFLGHAQMTTTEVYTRISKNQLKHIQ